MIVLDSFSCIEARHDRNYFQSGSIESVFLSESIVVETLSSTWYWFYLGVYKVPTPLKTDEHERHQHGGVAAVGSHHSGYLWVGFHFGNGQGSASSFTHLPSSPRVSIL